MLIVYAQLPARPESAVVVMLVFKRNTIQTWFVCRPWLAQAQVPLRILAWVKQRLKLLGEVMCVQAKTVMSCVCYEACLHVSPPSGYTSFLLHDLSVQQLSS